MLVSFVLVVFLYMSTRFQHMGRYLLPIMPLAAVAAGYGVVVALAGRVRLFAAVAAALVLSTGVYAVAFHNIYSGPTPLVAATDWISKNVPPGSTIGSEHWDNSLPIGSAAQPYKLLTVPVFEPDDGTKLRKLYDALFSLRLLRAQLATSMEHDRASARPVPAHGALLPRPVRGPARVRAGGDLQVGTSPARRPPR